MRGTITDPAMCRRIGEQVIEERAMQGMKQCDLAERLGIGSADVCRMEHGARWTQHQIRRFAVALGCTPDDLVRGLDQSNDALNYSDALPLLMAMRRRSRHISSFVHAGDYRMRSLSVAPGGAA